MEEKYVIRSFSGDYIINSKLESKNYKEAKIFDTFKKANNYLLNNCTSNYEIVSLEHIERNLHK